MELLAAISGESLIRAVILVIVIGTIAGLLWWLISYIGLPAPFDKVARVIVAIMVVVFLISVLMSIAGYQVISW